MRSQSVSRRQRAGMAGGDGGLQRVRAVRAAERLGAVERGQAAADEQLVPARAVLVEQQHRLARPGAGREPGRLDLHQRRQPVHLRLGRRELASRRPSRRASSHSSGRIQSSPAVAE